MHRPEQGADKLQHVAKGHGKIIVDAEQVETADRQHGSQPGGQTGRMLEQQAEDRHQDQVKPRDETGLGRRRIEEANLLQGSGDEEHGSREQTRLEQ